VWRRRGLPIQRALLSVWRVRRAFISHRPMATMKGGPLVFSPSPCLRPSPLAFTLDGERRQEGHARATTTRSESKSKARSSLAGRQAGDFRPTLAVVEWSFGRCYLGGRSLARRGVREVEIYGWSGMARRRGRGASHPGVCAVRCGGKHKGDALSRPSFSSHRTQTFELSITLR